MLSKVSTFVVSFAVITLLFAMIYKVLPDVKIAWRDVWVGAVVTALLFTIGKFLIGLYLGQEQRRLDLRRGGLAGGPAALDLLLVADPLPRRRVHAGLRHPLRLADQAEQARRAGGARRRR